MPSLLTARNLPGTGDFDPPEGEDLPECGTCFGWKRIDCAACDDHGRSPHCKVCDGMSTLICPDCNGTGYQPEPEYEPGIEVDE